MIASGRKYGISRSHGRPGLELALSDAPDGVRRAERAFHRDEHLVTGAVAGIGDVINAVRNGAAGKKPLGDRTHGAGEVRRVRERGALVGHDRHGTGTPELFDEVVHEVPFLTAEGPARPDDDGP